MASSEEETEKPRWGKFDANISNIEDGETVWRYIDLAKFVDLLVKRRIYFCRSDLLEDSFEGMPPGPVLKYLHDRYREFNDIGRAWEDPVATANQTLTELRKSNFINSWYLSGYESAAMWSLYSKIGSGIAIQSTIGGLRCEMPPNVCVGKVMYVNFETAKIDVKHDIRGFFFLKRNHFEHEREVRALYSVSNSDTAPAKPGRYVEGVHLERMIQSVVLAPRTPDWFRDSIEEVMKTFLPDVHVRKSSLDAEPPIKSSKPM